MGNKILIVTTSCRGDKIEKPLEAAGRDTDVIRIQNVSDIAQLTQTVDGDTTTVIVDSLGFPLLFTALAKSSYNFSLILRLRGEGLREYKEEMIVKPTVMKLYPLTKILSTHLGSRIIDGSIPVSKHIKQEGVRQGLCTQRDPVVPTPVLANVSSTNYTTCYRDRVEIAVVTNFDYWNKVRLLPDLLSCGCWGAVDFSPYISVYGDGRYHSKVKREVNRDYVSFEGFEPNIHQKLDNSDVFLYATKQDGYPSTIVEAQYHGLPVVANRYGPIPEQISHRHDGLLYSIDNVGEAADLVSEVVNNPTIYTRLSQNSYRVARMRNNVRQVGELLNQAIIQIRN